MTRGKYYVVWKGRRRGIFSSWEDCRKQVDGFVGAQFKGFDSIEEARDALAGRYEGFAGKASSSGRWRRSAIRPELPSLAVDAACSGSPGRLEYRGVLTDSGQQIFRSGPFAQGTNNVGEFLAIVEALRWLQKNARDWPVYSDSENAIGWVRHGRARTKLIPTAANRPLFRLLAEAQTELSSGGTADGGLARGRRLIKWNTAKWGEIPADFGRK